MLLAEIIERATGQSLAQFAEAQIFHPLGMNNTFFSTSVQRPPAAAVPYLRTEGRWIETRGDPDPKRAGAGGLMTTLDDYARWAQFLMNHSDRVLGDASLATLLRTPGTLANGERLQYALGLEVEPFLGVPALIHGGSGDGYKAMGMIFPTLNLLAAGFCNNGIVAKQIVMEVAENFIGAQARKTGATANVVASLPKTQLQGLAGVYREPRLRLPAFVTANDTVLEIGYDTDRPEGYMHVGNLQFRSTSDQLVEFRGQDPKMSLVQIRGSKYGTRVFERITPVTVQPSKLSTYAGDYYSAELDTTYRFAVDGDRLSSRIVAADRTFACEYRPMLEDEFVCLANRLTIRFIRDARGVVNGLRMTAQHGWVNDIAFTRPTAR